MMNVLHTLMSSNTFSPVADALSTSGSLFQVPSHVQLSSGAAAAWASESFQTIYRERERKDKTNSSPLSRLWGRK